MLPFGAAPVDFAACSAASRRSCVEIGFGMGSATAAIAAAPPHVDFVGIEVHPPGVGALLQRIDERGSTNVRIVQHDAVEVLEPMIAPASLAGVHVFFPDPWHKKRHHKRRLIQRRSCACSPSRLAPGATLHCATDWQPYAEQMLEVLSAEPTLVNTAGDGFAPRPASRPLTKFEQRGLDRGHGVWDLVFGALTRASAAPRPAQSSQTTPPLHAVASTTRPKAIRYQANGTKVWRRDVAQQPAHAEPRGQEREHAGRPRTAAGRPPTAARAPSTGCRRRRRAASGSRGRS